MKYGIIFVVILFLIVNLPRYIRKHLMNQILIKALKQQVVFNYHN